MHDPSTGTARRCSAPRIPRRKRRGSRRSSGRSARRDRPDAFATLRYPPPSSTTRLHRSRAHMLPKPDVADHVTAMLDQGGQEFAYDLLGDSNSFYAPHARSPPPRGRAPDTDRSQFASRLPTQVSRRRLEPISTCAPLRTTPTPPRQPGQPRSRTPISTSAPCTTLAGRQTSMTTSLMSANTGRAQCSNQASQNASWPCARGGRLWQSE